MGTMVEGWLCRDEDGRVYFNQGPRFDKKEGIWVPGRRGQSWGEDAWKAIYDLAPPKPGEKFPASIEL